MSEKEIIQNATLHIIRPQKYQMAFWGLIILIGGIAIGSATTVLVTRRGPHGPMPGMEASAQRMVDGMSMELGLSPEQQRRIEPIVKQHMAKLDEIRSKAQPQIAEQFRLMHDEIASILTPQQVKIWEERLTRIPEGFRPSMMPRDQRFNQNGRLPGQMSPDLPNPAGQPLNPARPGAMPRNPQQRPQGMVPQPGGANQQAPRAQEDNFPPPIFDGAAPQGQSSPQSDAQAQPEPQPQPGPDGMLPPPDDGGQPGPPPGDAGPDGAPMGPPPEE